MCPLESGLCIELLRYRRNDGKAGLQCRSQYHSSLGHSLNPLLEQALRRKRRRASGRWQLDDRRAGRTTSRLKVSGSTTTEPWIEAVKRVIFCSQKIAISAQLYAFKKCYWFVRNAESNQHWSEWRNTAAIEQFNKEESKRIKIRQCNT